MKYTRYNYKNNRSIYLFVVTIILGVVIGTYIFNFMVKDIKLIDTDIPLSRECISVSDKTCNYYFLQCGVYSTKENAVSFLDGCPLNEDCFIIEETGKYKVLCGLYNNNDICKKEEILNKSKIDSFKIKLDSGIAEQESRVKYELINGYIQIMDKVSENEVKSIKTNEFKEWAKKILENKGQLTEVEKELKEKIEILPEEYTKNMVNKDRIDIYKICLKK